MLVYSQSGGKIMSGGYNIKSQLMAGGKQLNGFVPAGLAIGDSSIHTNNQVEGFVQHGGLLNPDTFTALFSSIHKTKAETKTKVKTKAKTKVKAKTKIKVKTKTKAKVKAGVKRNATIKKS